VVKPTSPPTIIANACQQWYTSYAGQEALAQLKSQVDHLSNHIFGYYALELGALVGTASLLSQSRISTRLSLSPQVQAKPDIIASPSRLPLDFQSLDLVIAAHVLDESPQPHQVLRELERVLMPEGHCILIGFNPISWRGLTQRLPWKPKAAARYRYVLRVKDWLNVLGLDVLGVYTLKAKPNPNSNAKKTLWQRLKSNWQSLGQTYQLFSSPLYIIHAQKKVAHLTMITPKRPVLPRLQPNLAVNTRGHVTNANNGSKALEP
jgi:SAM-dependent methyltransferase